METVQSVMLTATALGGLVVAIVGLYTWRHQLRGGAEYDIARRLFRAALKVRDAMAAARAPFMSSAEMAAAAKELGVPEEVLREDEGAAFGAGTQVRWNSVAKALSELEGERLEAEVLLPGAVDALRPLQDCARELYFALMEYLRGRQTIAKHAKRARELHGMMGDAPPPEVLRASEKEGELSKIVFGGSENPEYDPLTPKVREAIHRVEAFARPYLASPGTTRRRA